VQVHAEEKMATAAAAQTYKTPPSMLPRHVSVTVEDPPAASPARPQQDERQNAANLSRPPVPPSPSSL